MKDLYLLQQAFNAYSGLAELRDRRQRYKRFTYGDQWGDLVRDSKGNLVKEEDKIISTGRKPLTNNLIRQLVKTIVGHFRNGVDDSEFYGGEMATISERNQLSELDARLLEEFLISGSAIQRIVEERRWDGSGVWIDNVSLRHFFVNRFEDPRGMDISLVGQLHDMSLPEIINRFSDGSEEGASRIRRLYSLSGLPQLFPVNVGLNQSASGVNFFQSDDIDSCRVIEVWSFDSFRSGENGLHDFMWRCRFFAPDGTVLSEFDSPYSHHSHPYMVKFYPLIDGEVHSFVEDVIDQQKYINRLIVTIDHIMNCSAKGVLLFPVEQLPPGVGWDKVTENWAQADGVIPITGRSPQMPQQVISNSGNTDAHRLLDVQLKLFREVSGVSDALAGQVTGARGAEMLESQVRNATISLSDIFKTFGDFMSKRNDKALKSV